MITEKRIHGEIQLSLRQETGITVGELHELLGHLMQNNSEIRDKPVALCIPDVAASDTLIVEACNEGDDSIVWLRVAPTFEADVIMNRLEMTQRFPRHL